MRCARSVTLASVLAIGAAVGGEAGAGPAPVIGGTDVPAGRWRDVAAVLFDNAQACTGVLIAPTVVMTAAHCLDRDLNAVLLGTHSLARPGAGETIDVVEQIGFPGDKYDVALLVLARASRWPVRRLATGWAQDQIVDGAAVELVGYGAIDRDAEDYIDELQEARSTITDAGCTRRAGCDPGARPDGEIGAGGAGIDTCPGDSGGPMYLLTDGEPLLVGITSRGYEDNQFDCSEGGIYVRPDKDEIVAWVEGATGVHLVDGRGPLAEDEDVTMPLGSTETIAIAANDPRSGATHTWRIETPPATGTATVDGDGVVTVVAPDQAGDALVVVRVVDAADPGRAARIGIALHYRDDDDGGCCQTGSPGAAAAPLAAAVGLLLSRRRRRGVA